MAEGQPDPSNIIASSTMNIEVGVSNSGKVYV